jgi:hypothetical protein
LKKKAVASVKTVAAKPTTPELMVPTLASPLEKISDILHRLPLHACVELTRGFLTSIFSLSTGTFLSLAAFVTEYCRTP